MPYLLLTPSPRCRHEDTSAAGTVNGGWSAMRPEARPRPAEYEQHAERAGHAERSPGGLVMGDEVHRHVRTRLRELRGNVGMGVRTLSVLADVPEMLLHDIESGRAAPTIATLMALARALGVGVREFFE